MVLAVVFSLCGVGVEFVVVFFVFVVGIVVLSTGVLGLAVVVVVVVFIVVISLVVGGGGATVVAPVLPELGEEENIPAS